MGESNADHTGQMWLNQYSTNVVGRSRGARRSMRDGHGAGKGIMLDGPRGLALSCKTSSRSLSQDKLFQFDNATESLSTNAGEASILQAFGEMSNVFGSSGVLKCDASSEAFVDMEVAGVRTLNSVRELLVLTSCFCDQRIAGFCPGHGKPRRRQLLHSGSNPSHLIYGGVSGGSKDA